MKKIKKILNKVRKGASTYKLHDDEIFEEPDDDLGEVLLGSVVAIVGHDLGDAGVRDQHREVGGELLA